MRRFPRSAAAWLAAFAMALHALWPLMAQARPASVALVPVCTIDGATHFIALDTGKAPAERGAESHAEHCKLCFFEPDRVIAPALACALAPAAPGLRQAVARDVLHAATSPSTDGRPRAPPSPSLASTTNDLLRRSHEQGMDAWRAGVLAGAAFAGRGELRRGILHDQH